MFALNGEKQAIGDAAPCTVLYDFLRSSTPFTVSLLTRTDRCFLAPDVSAACLLQSLRNCDGGRKSKTSCVIEENLAIVTAHFIDQSASRFNSVHTSLFRRRAPRTVAGKVDVVLVLCKCTPLIAKRVS